MDVIRAQSILIVPKQSTDLAVLYSALALGKVLTEQNKNVHYFLTNEVSNATRVFSESDQIINASKTKNELTLTLSKIQSKISKLDWEQIGNSLKIVLKSDESEIGSPDLSINHRSVNYDLRIFLEISREEVDNLPNVEDDSIFSGTSVFLEDNKHLSNPAVTVYRFINKTKYKINSEPAMLLFKSLRESTENFNNKISSEVFKVASDFLEIAEEEVIDVESTQDIESEEKPNTTPTLVTPTPETPRQEVINSLKPKGLKPEAKKSNKNEKELVPVEEFATPEELPPDYDPLSPATKIPEPIKLEQDMIPIKPQVNSPLPQAS